MAETFGLGITPRQKALIEALGKPSHRPIFMIAQEIRADWGSKVNFAAKPYLEAMFQLTKVGDKFGADDARSIILYFLSNASSWRGETAKRLKAELKAIAR